MERAPRISLFAAQEFLSRLVTRQWKSDLEMAVAIRFDSPTNKFTEILTDLKMYRAIDGRRNMRTVTALGLDLAACTSREVLVRAALAPELYRATIRSLATEPNASWQSVLCPHSEGDAKAQEIQSFGINAFILGISQKENTFDRDAVTDLVSMMDRVATSFQGAGQGGLPQPKLDHSEVLLASAGLGLEVVACPSATDMEPRAALQQILLTAPDDFTPGMIKGWGALIQFHRHLSLSEGERAWRVLEAWTDAQTVAAKMVWRRSS
jgi:hypothetical protein